MGLDMYLTRKVCVKNWNYMTEEQKSYVAVKGAMAGQVNTEKVTYIEEEVMYWRKANAIHQWFVENVQDGNDDCGYYYVGKEQLKELHDKVSFVLANREAEVASEELPPQSGFFFGSNYIDEWYGKDMEHTEKGLKKILEREDDRGNYYYHASW